jgi:hypothetical protein
MRRKKISFLATVVLLFVGYVHSADSASTVKLRGRETTGDDPGATFAITLTIGDNTWTEVEPGGVSKVFKVKKGVWSRAIKDVDLTSSDGKTKIGKLHELFPESAKRGDKGTGDSDLAVIFDWEVQ